MGLSSLLLPRPRMHQHLNRPLALLDLARRPIGNINARPRHTTRAAGIRHPGNPMVPSAERQTLPALIRHPRSSCSRDRGGVKNRLSGAAVSEVGLRSATERCGDGTLRDIRGCTYRRGARGARCEVANREEGDTCEARASALGRGSSAGAPSGGARVSGCVSAGVDRLCHRLLGRPAAVASGSWGGQRPSLGSHVKVAPRRAPPRAGPRGRRSCRLCSWRRRQAKELLGLHRPRVHPHLAEQAHCRGEL